MRKALLVDDEPEYLDWVREFLESYGIGSDIATNVADAFALIEKGRGDYVVALVDMNIPSHGAIAPDLVAKMPLVDKYAGLAVAMRCRNRGFRPHQVIAYTVHDDDAADAEMQKFDCRYVLKARPDVLKGVLLKSIRRPRKPAKRARGSSSLGRSQSRARPRGKA